MIFSMDDATADLEAEKLRGTDITPCRPRAAAMSQARLAAIAGLSYALNDPLQNLLGWRKKINAPITGIKSTA